MKKLNNPTRFNAEHVKISLIFTKYFYVLLKVHLDNLRNENQPDALFILNLFRQKNSTCFGSIYCQSSGGIHCICTAVGTCYTFRLTGSRPATSQPKRMTNTVKPRFTNSPFYEQFGSRTNFSSKNFSDDERCLGLRTRKLATAASRQQRQAGNSGKPATAAS
jgi:hypothetical protein